MKKLIIGSVLAALMALGSGGCSSGLLPTGHHVVSDQWSMTDIEGTWTCFNPWFNADGRSRIKFNAGFFEAWGYTEASGGMRIAANGSGIVESPILHFNGSYRQSNGNLEMTVVKAWTEAGVAGGQDDGSGKSSIEELQSLKGVEFVLQAPTRNVVKLLSSSTGPGHEGELNMVLQRNGEVATNVIGDIRIELNLVPKFAQGGFSFSSSGVPNDLDPNAPDAAPISRAEFDRLYASKNQPAPNTSQTYNPPQPNNAPAQPENQPSPNQSGGDQAQPNSNPTGGDPQNNGQPDAGQPDPGQGGTPSS